MIWKKLEEEMRSKLVERDEEIRSLIVAILTRENLLYIGPKGTAKSMSIKMIADALGDDVNYFEWLLTKYSTPEEVFGPIRVSKLENDIYERNTANKLPEAHFAFLDEIFKANSSILNSLLKILNEREYDNNSHPIKVPLLTCVGASNELPQDESLGALYDRFLLRHIVSEIQEESNFLTMLKTSDDDMKLTTKITLDDINQAIAEIEKIEIGEEQLELLSTIRSKLIDEGITPSSRRFKKAIKALKANAYLNGHSQVTNDDFYILKHILWESINQIQTVSKIIVSACNPYLDEAEEWIDAAQEAYNELSAIDDNEEAKFRKATEVFHKLKKAEEELAKVKERAESAGIDTKLMDDYIKKIREIRLKKVGGDILALE